MKYNCFNSRSREGSDPALIPEVSHVKFQFTLPRGERRSMRAK